MIRLTVDLDGLLFPFSACLSLVAGYMHFLPVVIILAFESAGIALVDDDDIC